MNSIDNFTKWCNDFVYQSRARKLFNDFQNDILQGRDYNDSQLFKLIDKYTIEDTTRRFYKDVRKGTRLYRARIVKSFDKEKYYNFDINDNYIHGYNEHNSREAPLGVSGEGRNNIRGVSYLYVSKTEGTACVEVKSSPRDLISLATFETQRGLKIIDFSNLPKFMDQEDELEEISLKILFLNIMKSYISPVCTGEEIESYRTTQVITDYLRKTGIDGISYRSYYDRNGINYTFFNSHKTSFKFCGSRLLVNQSQRVSFLDFEQQNIKNVYSMNDTIYHEQDANVMMNEIMNTIIRESGGDKNK